MYPSLSFPSILSGSYFKEVHVLYILMQVSNTYGTNKLPLRYKVQGA